MKAFKPHNKKCRNPECKKPFRVTTPAEARATWCSTDCALAIVAIKREKARVEKERKERREIREAKAKIKRRADYLADAQAAFNAYIRERDHDQPCISCGRHHQGQWHAGHYRTVGSHPELRFSEPNCHKQCAPCNNHKSGNIVEYRINLVRRLGADAVAWLEGPHEPKKYTVEELVELAKKYRALRRELVKAREAGAHGGGTSW